MEILGENAASVASVVRISHIEAAQLVSLEELHIGHVIDFPGPADGLVMGSELIGLIHTQVIRLLMIRVVAGGDIATDDQGKFMGLEIVLESGNIHTGGGKGGLLRRGQRHSKSRGDGAGHDFDRIKFPEQIRLGNENVRTPVTHLIGQATRERGAGGVEAVGEYQEFQTEIIAGGRKTRVRRTSFRLRISGVGGNHKAFGSHERIAIQAGEVRRDVGGRIGVGMGRARGQIVDPHIEGIEIGVASDGDDLARAVRRELRRVHAIEKPGRGGVFPDVQEVIDRVGVVVASVVIHVVEIRVIRERSRGIAAANFLPANVVQSFLIGAVLSDSPGKKLIEVVAKQPCAGQQIGADGARFWKQFCQIGRGVG